MADLVNELSWSFSRLGCFNECRRKYYWQYYGKWNGWKQDAPRVTRQAYFLSKMTTTDIFAGDVAHKMIAASVKKLRKGVKVHYEQLEPQLDGMLHSGFKASREKAWKYNPKSVNFFEDYYGSGISEEKMAEIFEKTNTAVSNFFRCSSFKRLTDERVKEIQWLAVDDDNSFSHFFLDDIKVFAEPDLAVGIAGKCYLFDWKTGRASSDHEQQLMCYALYACSRWNVLPENIVARAVYLNAIHPDTSLPIEHPVKYDAELAESLRDLIRNTYADMAKLVTYDNKADIENFPKTNHLSVCRRCNFQELCGDE